MSVEHKNLLDVACPKSWSCDNVSSLYIYMYVHEVRMYRSALNDCCLYMGNVLGSSSTLDRSTMHPKFNPIGA